MTFWDNVKADIPTLFNPADFGEWVTWKDQEGLVADKRMAAIIDRRGPEFDLLEESNELTSESVIVTLIHDAATGLESVRTGDVLSLSVRVGEAEKDCKIVEVIDTTPAFFTVGVET